MNLDALLLDIIKDKTKGHFNDNVEEIMKTQYISREEVLRDSIEKWFGLQPTERKLSLSAKTAHGRKIQKNVRDLLPYHNNIRARIYLLTLKKEREAMLSNIDD